MRRVACHRSLRRFCKRVRHRFPLHFLLKKLQECAWRRTGIELLHDANKGAAIWVVERVSVKCRCAAGIYLHEECAFVAILPLFAAPRLRAPRIEEPFSVAQRASIGNVNMTERKIIYALPESTEVLLARKRMPSVVVSFNRGVGQEDREHAVRRWCSGDGGANLV